MSLPLFQPESRAPVRHLLALMETGVYPNFTALYQRLGYQVQSAPSPRKALALLKQQRPDAVVAEFSRQSARHDRLGNLDSLLAAIQAWPQTRVVVLYPFEFQDILMQLQQRFGPLRALPHPVSESQLREALGE